DAGVSHTLDDLGEWPHHLRVFWTPEIEAIRKTKRSRTDACKIARRFRDHQSSSHVGIEIAVATVAVHRKRKPLVGSFESDHRSIGAGSYDCIVAHEMIVLSVNPFFRGDVR